MKISYNCIFFPETQKQQGGESMSQSASISLFYLTEWQMIC